MAPIDFLAGLPHYADHLMPVWWALPPDERGEFYVGRAAAQRVAREGIEPILGKPPAGDRLTVTAAFSDLRAAARRECVLVEHGAGQSYDGDPISAMDASYSGGRERGNVVLFICPNPRVVERNHAAYPTARVAMVGSPRLDVLATRLFTERPPNRTPLVAISFHWDCPLVPETRSAWRYYAEAITELVADLRAQGDEAPYRLLGHGHPRLWPKIAPWWEALGVEPVPEFSEVLRRADCFVADNTSAMYEFAAADRPVVVLNAPWYRRDVEHGLRFWTHSRLGIMVDKPWDLGGAIHTTLTAPPPTAAPLRRQIVQQVYPLLDGYAAERAADAILQAAADLEGQPRRTITMGNPYAPAARARRVQPTDRFPEARLRRLGASPETIAEARLGWDAMDPQEQAESLAAQNALSDEELAAAISEVEHDPLAQSKRDWSLTDDERAHARRLVRGSANMAAIMDWVTEGDRPYARAAAVAAEETQMAEDRGKDPRKSLLSDLEAVRNAADA